MFLLDKHKVLIGYLYIIINFNILTIKAICAPCRCDVKTRLVCSGIFITEYPKYLNNDTKKNMEIINIERTRIMHLPPTNSMEYASLKYFTAINNPGSLCVYIEQWYITLSHAEFTAPGCNLPPRPQNPTTSLEQTSYSTGRPQNTTTSLKQTSYSTGSVSSTILTPKFTQEKTETNDNHITTEYIDFTTMNVITTETTDNSTTKNNDRLKKASIASITLSSVVLIGIGIIIVVIRRFKKQNRSVQHLPNSIDIDQNEFNYNEDIEIFNMENFTVKETQESVI